MSARQTTFLEKYRRWALAGGLLLGLGAQAGCAYSPDHCADNPYACLNVSVEDGPPEVYQLRVRVLEGFGSTTPLTPRRQPDKPLVYPLRFAIRFDVFDDAYKGEVAFEISALGRDGATLGDLQEKVSLGYTEHRRISVRLGAPFDMATTDEAVPTIPLPDLTTPPPPDMSGADMATQLDMP